MAPGRLLPILRVPPEKIADRVLVVGDPARAEEAALLLDAADRIGANREYVTFLGSLEGHPVSICSHGVGSAGAGICFEELARAGARVMIRAGSCGALRDDIHDGELVVATGAVRDEGLTPRLVPASYPALAHPEAVSALHAAATARGVATHSGIVLSTDLFYPSAALGRSWEPWQRCGVAAVEMELAALFVIASLHGMRAGGILTVDGNPTRAALDMSEYDPYRQVVREGTDRMLAVALDALTHIEVAP